jgi:D-glycero-D-manno-heptose 1,7-bisphosphate phosphatase
MHPQRPKLVILGRDGVLNIYRDDHVTAPEEWQPVPGALEAVARLNQAGWHAVVATNQSGIGRGCSTWLAKSAPAHDAVAGARRTRRRRLLPACAGRLAIAASPSGPDERSAPQVTTLAGADGRTPARSAGAQATSCERHCRRHAEHIGDERLHDLRTKVPGTGVHEDPAAFADFRPRRGEVA